MATAPTEIEIGDFLIDIRNSLGSSGKVQVYPGTHKKTGQQVAAKKFLWGKDFPPTIVDEEVQTMRSIPDNDNTLKIIDYIKVDIGKHLEIWIILEFCGLGDLSVFGRENKLTLSQKADLMLQSAKGIAHLHSLPKAIIHRDIKPANILVSGSTGAPLIKIADFGESRFFEGSKEQSVRNMTIAGTFPYMAPELFSDKKTNKPAHNKAVDVFALAISFHYLLDAEQGVYIQPIEVNGVELGRKMYEDNTTDVAALLVKCTDSEEVKEIKKLITDMLAHDPDKRPRIGDVVDRLSQLRTSLGVQVLMAVDTVWGTSVCYMNNDCLDHMKSSKTDKDEVQQSPVTSPLPHKGAPLTMNSAEQVSQEVAEQIMRLGMEKDIKDKSTQASLASPSNVSGAAMGSTRGAPEDPLTATAVQRDIESNTRDMKNNLMAIGLDLDDTTGVWVLEDTKWVKLYNLTDEYPEYRRICLVSNDIVIVSRDATLLFSLSTKQWKKLSRMPTSRYNTSAVAIDDKLMVVGGKIDGKDSNVCEILHVKHNKWSTGASLPKPLKKPLLTVLASRVFILPQDYDLPTIFRTQLLMYDPLSNTYSHRARLPSNIHNTIGACLVGVTDMLHLLGGMSWQYNYRTDQWIQLVTPTANYDSWDGCCAVVRDNNILLCGGSKGRDKCNMIEEYNTVTQQWKVLDIHLPFQYDQDCSAVFNVGR